MIAIRILDEIFRTFFLVPTAEDVRLLCHIWSWQVHGRYKVEIARGMR